MKKFPEEDWKILKKHKDLQLQMFCSEALDKLNPVIENRGSDSHQAYLNLWKIINQEDKELSTMFDDLKRSTAFFKLAMWKKSGLLSDKESENQVKGEEKESGDPLISQS